MPQTTPNSDDPKTARLITVFGPHAAHELWLIDQADKPTNNIYEVRESGKTRGVALVGSELQALAVEAKALGLGA